GATPGRRRGTVPLLVPGPDLLHVVQIVVLVLDDAEELAEGQGESRPAQIPVGLGQLREKILYLDAVALQFGDELRDRPVLPLANAARILLVHVRPKCRGVRPLSRDRRAQKLLEHLVVAACEVGEDLLAGPAAGGARALPRFGRR